MEYHEAANIFPLMDQAGVDALAADIAENGLQHPIEIYDNKILDGRNRWVACTIAEVDADIVDVTRDVDDPIAYVLSLNLHRRHLDETQRAMVGARVKDQYAKQAKERQGTRTDIKENFPECNGQSRDHAGDAVGVSGKSVDAAEKVLTNGSKQLQQLCDAGKVSVSAAARVAELPKSKQNEVIQSAKGSVKKAVADAAKQVTRLKHEDDDWSTSERNRKKQVESGKTVIANKKTDFRLIAWADKNGLAVDVGRGTIWGNPFLLDEDGTRDEVCDKFATYYKMKPSLQKRIKTLKGKVLLCWCHPARCHAEELRRLAK
jgi:hypothetical protein